MKNKNYDEYFDLFCKIKKLKMEIYNLHGENMKLRQVNKLYETYFESDVEVRDKLVEKVKDYKNRIEKAIKFIDENKTEVELDEYLLCDCLYDEKTIELLEILKGSDKEC